MVKQRASIIQYKINFCWFWLWISAWNCLIATYYFYTYNYYAHLQVLGLQSTHVQPTVWSFLLNSFFIVVTVFIAWPALIMLLYWPILIYIFSTFWPCAFSYLNCGESLVVKLPFRLLMLLGTWYSVFNTGQKVVMISCMSMVW